MGFLASKARPVWRESEMMQRCFSSFYWHFSIGTIDMKDLVDQCVVNREWNCLVKTSRGIKYDWTPFINFIHPYFLKLPIKGEGTLRFGPPWMNVYEKGGYQEAHHHVANGNQLSYCYFYRLPEKSGQFGFFNENYRTQCANQFNEVLAVDEIVEWSFPKVSEGDLLIFPSFLIHQVTYQPTEEKRVTIAGNVVLHRMKGIIGFCINAIVLEMYALVAEFIDGLYLASEFAA
jgi:hypothetical protein